MTQGTDIFGSLTSDSWTSDSWKLDYPKVRKLIWSGLVLFFIWSGAPQAEAQETLGIKIQPSLIEERVDPGQALPFTLRITNQSKETRTFYLLRQNIKGISDRGTPIFSDEKETEYDLSSWVKLSQESVVIDASRTAEVPFTIEVPQNASPGGHFGGIIASFTPERPKETGVGVGLRLGTIINLRISGEVFEEAQIREFRTDKTIYGRPEVKFFAKVENKGNVLIRPRGPLEIIDFFGSKVATLRINNEGAGIFPRSTREFETTWTGEGFTFGRYEALVSLIYGEDERKTIVSTRSFWIIPLNLVLPVGGGLFGLILVVILSVKLYVRFRIKKIQALISGTSFPGRAGGGRAEYMRRYHRPPAFLKLALAAIILLAFIFTFLMIIFLLFA